MPGLVIGNEVSAVGRRLLGGLILLNALACAWIYAGLADSRQNHERQTEVVSRNMAQALDQSVSSSVEKINVIVLSSVDFLEDRLRSRKPISTEEVNAFFLRQQGRLTELVGLRATDAKGVVVYGTDVRPGETASWADRDFFIAQQTNPAAGMTVSDPLMGKIAKRWVVPFSLRYNDADGNFAGVVSATVDVKYLDKLLSTMNVGPSGTAVLRDSKMALIARYPRLDGPAGAFGSKDFPKELDDAVASGNQVVTYHTQGTYDGVDRIITYRRLTNVPFHVLAGHGAPDYLRDFQREKLVGISQLLAFLLTSSLGAWLIWRSIKRAALAHESSRALLRGASDGFHVLDAAGNLVEASDSFFDMLGYPRAEGMTLNVRDWDAHFPHAQLGEIIQTLLQEGRSTLLSRHRRQDGSEFAVEVNVLPAVMQGKELLFCSSRDVSERLQAQELLARSNAMLEESQEIAQVGGWEEDVDTGQVRWTAQTYRIHDTSPEVFDPSEDSGGSCFVLDSRERLRIARNAALHNREPYDLELQALTATGRRIDVRTTGKPTLEEGRVVRLSGIFQDITERKQAEKELQQSHDLLSKMSDQVPGVLFQFKMDAQGKFSAPFASRFALELFGLEPGSIKEDAIALFAVVLDEDRDSFIASVQRSAQTLEDWVGEFRVELPGQGIRWRLGQARPERQADGSTLWYGFIADATERIEAQNQLRELNESLERRVQERTAELALALQSAEMANRSRGEFLANTSHEIRTPMNSVLGMVYLALKSNTDPRQREYLERIQRAGVHLMRIIDDILDFSKIDAGKLYLDVAGFDLSHALEHLIHLAEGRAHEKGLSLRLEKDDSVPHLLMGDALRIEQILLNFVNNAIKFTEHGGVVLRVQCVERDGDRCLLRFEVSDSGVGLSDEETGRLFQSFEQGDKSTTRRFGGTGLGLAICRQLARLMEGEVGVNSAPGIGSTFWFQAQFPIPQAVPVLPDSSGDQQMAIAALRGTSMLVVDDNEFNLDVARGLLEDVGVQVSTAANGALAIAMLQNRNFDCVLMDVQMPVMDGHTATRQIRADPRFRQTLIIAMTANASGSDRILCLEAGMDDVIRKPIDPAKMFQTLAQGLQGAGYCAAPEVVAAPPSSSVVFAELEARLDSLPAWDNQALGRMVGSNQEAQQRLLHKFLSTAAQTVEELSHAAATQNWSDAASLGHKLKSSARSVGAMQLGALCEALEQDGKLAQASRCEQLVGRVHQAFEVVQMHIRKAL